MNKDPEKFPSIEYFELDKSTETLVERELGTVSWLNRVQEIWRLHIVAFLGALVAILLLILVAVIITKAKCCADQEHVKPASQNPQKVYSLAHERYEYLPSTASSLLASLNESVDPCDDFYDYACGGWVDQNPMPDDVKSVWFWARFTLHTRLKNKILTDILRSNITADDSRPLTYAKDIFVSCLKEDEVEITSSNRSAMFPDDFDGMKKNLNVSETVSEEQLDKESGCLKKVYTWLGLVVEMEYIKLVITNDTKEKVTEMFGKIQNASIELVRSSVGMSEYTKTSIITKLRDIILCAVHPDWLYNDTKIESLYKGLDIGNGSYKEKQDKLDAWTLKQQLYDSATHAYNFWIKDDATRECDWNPTDPSLGPEYSIGANIVYIPAAFVYAYYDQNRPASFNYGELGFPIGHEIGHGIYSEGIELHALQYQKIRDCLVDEYHSFNVTDDFGNPINEHIDGELTLEENYSDQIGVIESFKAMQEYLAGHPGGFDEEILPELVKFSTEQLFFLTFANGWCASIRRQDLRDIIESDTHSPNKFRILGPLIGFDKFAKAWHCPVGSRMNPDPIVGGCSGGVYNATARHRKLPETD